MAFWRAAQQSRLAVTDKHLQDGFHVWIDLQTFSWRHGKPGFSWRRPRQEIQCFTLEAMNIVKLWKFYS